MTRGTPYLDGGRINAKALLLDHAAEELTSAPRKPSREWDRYMRETLSAVEEAHPTLPVLTPRTWDRVTCRCGTCDVCVWFARVEAENTDDGWGAWTKTHRLPRSVSAPRWSSVQAALEVYVTICEDGYSSGSMGVTELQRLGTMVQRSAAPAPPKATLAAEDVATIEGVLRRALDDEGEEVGLTARTAILFSRVVGREVTVKARGRSYRKREAVPVDELAERYDLSPGKVGGVVQRTMRRIRADMAARGLVRMPDRGTRAHAAAVQLLEEWEREAG